MRLAFTLITLFICAVTGEVPDENQAGEVLDPVQTAGLETVAQSKKTTDDSSSSSDQEEGKHQVEGEAQAIVETAVIEADQEDKKKQLESQVQDILETAAIAADQQITKDSSSSSDQDDDDAKTGNGRVEEAAGGLEDNDLETNTQTEAVQSVNSQTTKDSSSSSDQDDDAKQGTGGVEEAAGGLENNDLETDTKTEAVKSVDSQTTKDSSSSSDQDDDGKQDNGPLAKGKDDQENSEQEIDDSKKVVSNNQNEEQDIEDEKTKVTKDGETKTGVRNTKKKDFSFFSFMKGSNKKVSSKNGAPSEANAIPSTNKNKKWFGLKTTTKSVNSDKPVHEKIVESENAVQEEESNTAPIKKSLLTLPNLSFGLKSFRKKKEKAGDVNEDRKSTVEGQTPESSSSSSSDENTAASPSTQAPEEGKSKTRSLSGKRGLVSNIFPKLYKMKRSYDLAKAVLSRDKKELAKVVRNEIIRRGIPMLVSKGLNKGLGTAKGEYTKREKTRGLPTKADVIKKTLAFTAMDKVAQKYGQTFSVQLAEKIIKLLDGNPNKAGKPGKTSKKGKSKGKKKESHHDNHEEDQTNKKE